MKAKTAAVVAAIILAMGPLVIPVRAGTDSGSVAKRVTIDPEIVDELADVLAQVLDKKEEINCDDSDSRLRVVGNSINCYVDGNLRYSWSITENDLRDIVGCRFSLITSGGYPYLVYIPKGMGAMNLGELFSKGAIVLDSELGAAAKKTRFLRGGKKLKSLWERCQSPSSCF